MPIVNVFDSDLFSLHSLTLSINKLPFKPARIGQLGIFATQGVPTTVVEIEEQNGLLGLLPTRRRGEPASLGRGPKRTVRPLSIPHIPHEDSITAESVQNVRAFGSENQLETVATVVNDRLALMRQNHEVTLEHLRAGALQGRILDADGTTVLCNVFDEFKVEQQSTDFVFGTTTTDIQAKVLSVKRSIEQSLGVAVYDHVHCLCGETWWGKFIAHTLVKAAFDRYQEGAWLREDMRSGFTFCGVTFEEYTGTVGGVSFIPATEARFFPVGTPNLFITYFTPADFMETVNTIGLPVYAKQEPMKFNRGVDLHTQSNPLPICTRPRVLHRGFTSN